MSEKFVSPCPLPNGLQREVAVILLEECAEVQQRITKLLRFGLDEVQPGQDLTNRERVSMELGDLLETANLGCFVGLLDERYVEQGRSEKFYQLKKYMQNPVPPSPSR